MRRSAPPARSGCRPKVRPGRPCIRAPRGLRRLPLLSRTTAPDGVPGNRGPPQARPTSPRTPLAGFSTIISYNDITAYSEVTGSSPLPPSTAIAGFSLSSPPADMWCLLRHHRLYQHRRLRRHHQYRLHDHLRRHHWLGPHHHLRRRDQLHLHRRHRLLDHQRLLGHHGLFPRLQRLLGHHRLLRPYWRFRRHQWLLLAYRRFRRRRLFRSYRHFRRHRLLRPYRRFRATGSSGTFTLRRPQDVKWSTEDWLGLYDEKAGIAEYDHGMPRQQAEEHAFRCCLAKWLEQNQVSSDADDGCVVAAAIGRTTSC